MNEDQLRERVQELEALLREKLESGPRLDLRTLSNYPDSWEYRARSALGIYEEAPQPGQFSLYDSI